MVRFTPQELSNAVHGDLQAFSLLLKQEHATLRNCRAMLGELVVTPADVRKVLLRFQQEQVSPELVQQWASFLRRGITANEGGEPMVRQPVKSIDIEYEPKFEDAIVEVISRLDEIGDLIDGEVTPGEIETRLSTLPG